MAFYCCNQNQTISKARRTYFSIATTFGLNLYFHSRNELKITAIHQLKYATDQDFKIIGFSAPELRRMHKFYDKYYSQGYLSKIKRLLQAPKRGDEVSDYITTCTSNVFCIKFYLVSDVASKSSS